MTDPADPRRDDATRASYDAATTPAGVNTMCPQCGAVMPAFESQCSTCGHRLQVASDDEQREALRKRLQTGIGGAYELVQMIGKGGMGVVFRARERALDRDVALKVLAFDPALVPEAFMRFEREAKLAARLDHPNIVPIFAVGQGQGIAYYTMRLVRGGSLEEQLTNHKKLEPARAIRYLREIAAALDHAHAHGVVHRDIKPANVMLGDGDHVFVADFGIARAVGGDGGALTSTGVVGSPAYMAPEQWQGQGIDGRADQYALGILAYELLTGKRPYRDAGMHELLRMHLTENLPDISQELPGMSGGVRDALARATAKEPNDRFASTTEFVHELERALHARATPAHNAPTVAAGTTAPRPSGAITAADIEAVRTGRAATSRDVAGASRGPSRPANRVVPVAALMVLVAAASGVWWKSRSAEPAARAPVVPETVRVQTPAVPETVRVAAPIVADTNRPRVVAPAESIPPVPAAAQVAGSAYILIAHPLTPGNTYEIDGQRVAPKLPPVYAVAPGRHMVRFTSPVPTIPPQIVVMVRPGDTARALFAPSVGGGARGDQLRQQVLERARRVQMQQGGRGPGPRGGRPPVRGDTLGR